MSGCTDTAFLEELFTQGVAHSEQEPALTRSDDLGMGDISAVRVQSRHPDPRGEVRRTSGSFLGAVLGNETMSLILAIVVIKVIKELRIQADRTHTVATVTLLS